LSTIISDLVCRTRKEKPTPWRLPLEILNAVITLAAFCAATAFAGRLVLYCVEMDPFWIEARVLLRKIAPNLTGILDVCPLSKTTVAFSALAT
jgi:hypothetical protein